MGQRGCRGLAQGGFQHSHQFVDHHSLPQVVAVEHLKQGIVGFQQQVHDIGGHFDFAVADLGHHRLARVGQTSQLGEPKKAGCPFDGMDGAEQFIDGFGVRSALQGQQLFLRQLEVFAPLDHESIEQFLGFRIHLVVPPKTLE